MSKNWDSAPVPRESSANPAKGSIGDWAAPAVKAVLTVGAALMVVLIKAISMALQMPLVSPETIATATLTQEDRSNSQMISMVRRGRSQWASVGVHLSISSADFLVETVFEAFSQ